MKLPDNLLIFSILIIIFTFYGSNVVGEKNSYLAEEEPLLAQSRIVGNRAVCLTGSYAFIEYSTEVDPGDNVYWTLEQGGNIVSEQRGPVVSMPFTAEGTFTLSLRISRGGNPTFHTEFIEIIVERGPTFILQPDIVQCGSEEVTLTALDPNDPGLANFTIEWKDFAGNPIGTGNTIVTSTPGRYIVTVTSTACAVEGSTFVGPAREIEVISSTTNACFGQTVSFRPDVPVRGLWSFQKSDQATRTNLGEFFELFLDTDNQLDGTGEYTIFFNVEDQDRPGCSIEKQRNLIVRENASFQVLNVTNSESCDNPTGSFQLLIETGMQTVNVTGPSDYSFINVFPETVLDITDLEPGIYSISVESYGCFLTSTVTIDNLNPDAAIPFTVTSTDQECSGTGVVPGSMTITVENTIPDLQYRIINAEGEVIQGAFGNQLSVTENVLAGEYSIELIDAENCSSVSAEIYTVTGSNQVNFSVPTSITACEFYDLSPQSNEILRYEVTGPNGQITEDNGAFHLNLSGTYEILAISDDPNSPLCPNLQVIEVDINDQIEFNYSKRQIDCLGNQIYTAELLGMDPSTVFVRWLAADMFTILGRDLDFFPPSVGTFYLDVQPRASSPCPAAPIPFEVTIVDRTVEVEIEGSPFCGADDAFTTLNVVTDFDVIEFIDWYYTDEDGNYTHLELLENMESIDVANEGTYEAIVRNNIYCEMGRATFEVGRILEITFSMSAKQYICLKERRFNTLNPGDFASYTWLKDGNVVSTDSIFTPRETGNYELEIVDNNGCPVTTQFEVEDICAKLISMPSAMVPGDINRDFRIYANPAISEVEVFIFNKLGELIFHCLSENNLDTEAVCIWDGYVNGTKLMVGTYPVTIKYKVPSLNLIDHFNQFIVVPQ